MHTHKARLLMNDYDNEREAEVLEQATRQAGSSALLRK